MKPTIFISHSTSHLSDQDRVFQIKTSLCDLLEENWSVFVDCHSIRGGDKWRADILGALSRAHAGIVLFNERAVTESQWVQLEAMILCYRKFLDPERFQFVPVILDGLSVSDTCFKKYEPVQFEEIQAVLDDPKKAPREFASEIASRLAANSVPSRTNSRWVTRMSGLLRDIDDPIAYLEAAEQLELECEGQTTLSSAVITNSLRNTLVALMYHSEAMVCVKAISYLLTQFRGDAVRLHRHLVAKWVETESVEVLFNVSRHPEKWGLLTINAMGQSQVDPYLDRVRIELDHNDLMIFSTSDAVGDTTEAMVFQIEKTIRSHLRNMPLDEHFNDVPLEEAVRREWNKGTIMICALAPTFAVQEVLQLIRDRFPHMIFIVRIGNDQRKQLACLAAKATPLPPLLLPKKLNELSDVVRKLDNTYETHFIRVPRVEHI